MKKMISLLLALALCVVLGSGIAESVQDIFGTQDGAKYENPAMGLGCVLEGWNYHSQEEILARYNLMKESSSDDVAKILEGNQSVIVMFAENGDQTQNVNLVVDSAATPYVQAYGEETYLQELIKMYEQVAPGQGWKDYSAEVIHREIGGKEVFGIKGQFVMNGIQVYQLQFAYVNGDYVDICTITNYFDDNCDSILEKFYMLEQ